jgi:NitT/TauT family transport system ATP-binding protein
MVRRLKPLDQIRSEAAALLERFGLGAFKKHYPHQLSGGMQRRGELARALINDPLVLLMDEPFRGLDAMTRQLMQEYLARLFEETRTTTIFVTSEVDEAIYLADRIIVLSQAPAHVAETVEVTLPRPRDLSVFSSTAFAEIKSRILNVLYREAAAALKGNAIMPDFKEAFERRHAN